MTDYDGNVSEKVTYNFDDQGEPIIPEVFDRVFHLDAGRKYFSVQYIKQILDTMAEANFNQLELYFSDNQGFRFALEDMTVTTEFGTYDLTPSLGDGYVGDNKYPDNSGKYLTQSEMDEIISYANSKGIELVPAPECARPYGRHSGGVPRPALHRLQELHRSDQRRGKGLCQGDCGEICRVLCLQGLQALQLRRR